MPTPLDELAARLPDLMLRDARRLQRRVDDVRRRRGAGLDRLAAEVETAARRVERRREAVPRVSYPDELPVSQAHDELLAAIRDSQVVVVAGETGSGKTTQLPKICLELGRGVRGLIGHTQPRRIAARAVAERIAEELDVPLGGPVGYQVRFHAETGDETLVKLMTDGVLLAEIQRDRSLSAYDTIIIDEAHERSLNIDFLLGYLKQLLPRRPDLKVIITSATIDPGRFSRHFDDAPVVEVSGRTYPVEVRYRPVEDDSDTTTAIGDAVAELAAEGPGDVLVFLSGEREIRDTADALRGRELRDTEIVPLYGRLSAAEQHRVFTPHRGRRVVLATNVAETSLTVPGIRYVVDPGTARISRYSNRLKVQRLPIEPISQASAAQRAGRCGRVADGICIRLYDEDDHAGRPEFTDPEILRTNLASVILQLSALGLGDLAAFPFVDPPDRRQVRDGVQLLEELGALDPAQTDPRKRLTVVGRQLAQLPIDPRFARMVVEADRGGCLHEVLVITAALSIQDPRERPTDHQQAADESHRRFADPTSDFLSYLNLWNHLREQQEALSSSAFRRLCKAEFLHYLRIREWQDLYAQLRSVVRGLGWTLDESPAAPDTVHQALLAGLLSHIGLLDASRRDYLGARGARFAVSPGSALFKRPPRFAVAAELVETSRLWARVVARVEPEWVERLAGHLVARTYSEPHWERKRGGTVAFEKVTLYGVPLVAARKVDYGRIDPELSRELFIRHALVEGDWSTHHDFYARNQALLEDLTSLEDRARRRDLVVDDETLVAFYDERVPADVVSARHFDRWWKATRRETPELLTLTPEVLLSGAAGGIRLADYPLVWRQDGVDLPLSYRFEPGARDDGVTVEVPLPVLPRLSSVGVDWQVPGFREELVTALLKSLPKQLRREFVPAPDFARAVLARVQPGTEPLLDALERELLRLTGVRIDREDWGRVPGHLRMHVRVVDGARVVGEGDDLDLLQLQLRGQVRATVASAAAGLERTAVRSWSFGDLPRTVALRPGGFEVPGFPALVDDGDSVSVRVLATAAEQQRSMWTGTRRLLLLTLGSPLKAVHRRLSLSTKLALGYWRHGPVVDLLEDCVAAAVDSLVAAHGGPVWTEADFARLRDAVRPDLADLVLEVVTDTARVLTAARAVEEQLDALTARALQPSVADVRAQVAGLVHPGFVRATGPRRLPDVLRYLQAAERRVAALPGGVDRDLVRMRQVEHVQAELSRRLGALPPGSPARARLRSVRWMVEELRVSVFAQALGTRGPVSEARILRAIDDLAA